VVRHPLGLAVAAVSARCALDAAYWERDFTEINGLETLPFNPQVVGSIPTGPTKLVSIWSEDFAPRQELNVSANGLLMRRVEQRGEVPCRLLLKAS